MKIILIKNITKLGKIGTILIVKNGYAKNYLLPNGSALLASSRNIKNITTMTTNITKYCNDDNTKINNTTLIISSKIKANGEIYGVFNSIKFLNLIKKFKINLNIRNLDYNIFIKKPGNYKIELKNKKLNNSVNIYIMLIGINE